MESSKKKLIPIGVAARHARLNANIIRAWEQRYRIVKPKRDGNNRRLYSQQDVKRLNQLRIATRFGHRIGAVAALSLKQLKQLNEEDAAATLGNAPERRARPNTGVVMRYFDNCVDALNRMDGRLLLKEIEKSIKNIGVLLSLEELLLPLIHYVNDACRFGELNNGQKQLFYHLARSFLLLEGMKSGAKPQTLLVCQLQEDPELQALRAMVMVNQYGWRTVYVDAVLDSQTLSDVALVKRPELMLIALSGYGENYGIPNQLRRISSYHLARPGKMILLMPDGCADTDVAHEIGAQLIHESNQIYPFLEQAEKTF